MKRNRLLRSFWTFSLIAIASCWTSAFAQDSVSGGDFRRGRESRGDKHLDTVSTASPEALIFQDNFAYTVGTALTANGWTAHSGGGTNPILVTTPGLTYTGYPSSGIGEAVSLTTSGEDVHRTFAVQSSGSVYAGVMANFSEAAIDAAGLGGYFFHLGPDPIGTTFRGRIYVKKDASNNLAFGITKASTNVAADISFTPFSFALNQTHLLIIKYSIVDGATNDTVSLFVNPTLGGAEPAATVTAPDVGASDINPGSVALRQGATATSPTLRADGIRVGTVWADVAGAAGPAPSPAKLFTGYLNGANERPSPVATNATGFGRVVLNDAETQLTTSVYYNNLSSGTTVGHIHGPAPVTGTAPPIFNLNPTPGQTNGSVIDSVFAVTPQQVADLKAGLWYFNIHTTNFGGGEIRGQIFPAKAAVDMEGDGLSDYVVVRDSNGVGTPGGLINWYVMRNATSAFYQAEWGQVATNDVLVPADYDGDRKTDIAVWRPDALATFYIIQSATNTIYIDQLGIGTDTPVPGDWNGDGKAETATMRNAGLTSSWFYRPDLASMFVTLNLGDSGAAAHGDYDGNGKLNPAVFSTDLGGNAGFSVFYPESNLSFRVPYGLPTDRVAPGDYDGDGKTDYCVVRADGTLWRWDFDPSSTGGVTVTSDTWGLVASDILAPGDYNGDGRWDYGVWRNTAQGEFFVMTPITRQISTRQWGLAGDYPAAASIISNEP